MNFRFSQLFDQFNTVDSYTILAMLFIAFLLGLLVGMILQSGRLNRYREENEKLKREAGARAVELTTLRNQLTSTDAALAEGREMRTELEQERDVLREEVAEATHRAQLAEQEKQDLLREVTDAHARLEQLEASNKTYFATIEELNDRIIALQAQNDRLAEGQQAAVANHSHDRLVLIERKMSKLEAENDSLKKVLQRLHAGTAPAPPAVPADGLRAFTPFGGDERDDLTMIEGIDPVLEQQLHRLGVYSFEHISRWDNEQLQVMAAQLGDLKERIHRQQWIEQARRLAHLKKADPQDPAVFTVSETTDDLKVIEGIGPKIEQLLVAAGITTFERLADSAVDRLREVLDGGGEHYHLHDPTTWPIQARLATNGEWDLLRDYQEQLKGGREAAQEEE